jgi:hypothetical protein
LTLDTLPLVLLCCLCTGITFSEQGFDSMLEYLYTGSVPGVTEGNIDIDKLQASLVAAEFFNVDALRSDAYEWANICGVEIDTTSV